MPAVPKPSRRPKARRDTVDPADHLAVRRRDRMCFGVLAHLAQQRGEPWVAGVAPIPWHQCRTRFGREHAASDLDLLTVDHFHRHAGGTKGRRAASSMATMASMCAWLNDHPPSADVREAERAWVTHLYGSA